MLEIYSSYIKWKRKMQTEKLSQKAYSITKTSTNTLVKCNDHCSFIHSWIKIYLILISKHFDFLIYGPTVEPLSYLRWLLPTNMAWHGMHVCMRKTAATRVVNGDMMLMQIFRDGQMVFRWASRCCCDDYLRMKLHKYMLKLIYF